MELEIFAALVMKVFTDIKTLEESRKSPRDFTRKRKMPFERLLLFLLCGCKGATQAVLNEFFLRRGEDIHMTQQALSKARSHFDHTPFMKAFYVTVQAEYNKEQDVELPRRSGYKFIAIDGSVTALPNLPELAFQFGSVNGSPSARTSIALDVLNDRILDAQFVPLSVDERTCAVEHIRKLEGMIAMEDTVFVMDRGYPSKELIEAISGVHAHFLMRVRQQFSRKTDAAPMGESIVELWDGLRVRVVKFLLPSGELEILVTDLFDLKESEIKELYFLRWPVEIKFDIVKNKLELPNFTGRSENILYQDFWISMLLANAASVAKAEADKKIQRKRKEAHNKYEYQTNVNNIIASLRNRFADAVFCPNPILRAIRINSLIKEVAASVVPIRPDRHIPRKTARKVKYHHNKKSNV